LQHTGIAGSPTEYLSGGYEQYWRPRWGVKTYSDFLRRVTKIGTTPNGVFGVKVHPVQFAHFATRASGKIKTTPRERRELFEQSFPSARYVWLRRGDKLLQGISYARALQSRVWWDSEKAPAPYDAPRPNAVRFDRALLERCVTQMHLEEHTWRDYFDVNGIEPLQVVYEQLIEDPLAAVRDVLAYLDLELPEGFSLPPTRYKRQADTTTETWRQELVEAFVAEPAIRMVERLPVASAGAGVDGGPRTGGATLSDQPAGSPDHFVPTVAEPARPKPIRLEDVLASRRWWRCTTPFPHIRAENVFTPAVYEAMRDDFRKLLAEGQLHRDLPGYDASAVAITDGNVGAFAVLASRAWHDLWAGLFGANCSGELNVTLHHHATGSESGIPHNDLNPAFFLEEDRNADGLILADPKRCNYRHGRPDAPDGVVERVRAVALLFYLANDENYGVGWGGETGLYRLGSDRVDRPEAAVPAVNNSLVAFECTPFSFHSFISNTYMERNCVAMWLHRPKADVVERWGERTIVGW
jgi:LPS sulfotransferase NodH